MRRALLVGVAAVCLVLTSCDSQWLQYGYDSTHAQFNAAESTLTTSNVGQLTEAWSATHATTVVDGDVVPDMTVTSSTLFVIEGDRLAAYSRDASTGCGGSPTTCSPLWTSDASYQALMGPPTVSGSTVVVHELSGTKRLVVFDATGAGPSCSGTPVVCKPLWTAPVWSKAPVTVANGLIYVSDQTNQRLDVYDAAGQQGCSGSPVVCQPLWTSTSVGPLSAYASPAVANGLVYMSGSNGLSVFDAAGTTGCSGSPALCTPMWTAPTPWPAVAGPSVSAGRVFVPTYDSSGSGQGQLDAFDASGTTGCSGSPAVCAPLWATPPTDWANPWVTPAVANGTVYWATLLGVSAYDAAGIKSCSGTPLVCTPQWSTAVVNRQSPFQPVVAGGVLYVGTTNDVEAYDAAGVANCSGSICSPLLTRSSGWFANSAPIVSDGWMFAGAVVPVSQSLNAATTHAFRLPPSP
jgi:hypothetical protein